MIVHVRVHALVSLAASAAWPDKRREPNDKRQTDTGDFIDIVASKLGKWCLRETRKPLTKLQISMKSQMVGLSCSILLVLPSLTSSLLKGWWNADKR